MADAAYACGRWWCSTRHCSSSSPPASHDGFLLIMIGFLLQWPTLPTLMYVYARLARGEEREVAALFGEEWTAYAARTPAFWPRRPRRRCLASPGKDSPAGHEPLPPPEATSRHCANGRSHRTAPALLASGVLPVPALLVAAAPAAAWGLWGAGTIAAALAYAAGDTLRDLPSLHTATQAGSGP